MAAGAGLEQLKTPIGAPNANAAIDDQRERRRLRFLGSVRRECLDHMLVFSVQPLVCVVREYVGYFNALRPHQGIGQRIPALVETPSPTALPGSVIRVRSILGGLHHRYEKVA